MPTEAEAEAHAEFFTKYAASFPHGEYFDDDENDRIALIVNDEIPIEVCMVQSGDPVRIKHPF